MQEPFQICAWEPVGVDQREGKGESEKKRKERFGGGALTCSPRTAPLEHVDFRIPPGVHAVSVARRQTSVGLVEDDAWQGRRWSMFVRLAPTLSFGRKTGKKGPSESTTRYPQCGPVTS